jgi:hypothetical protein
MKLTIQITPKLRVRLQYAQTIEIDLPDTDGQEWMPIETAPKTGESILLLFTAPHQVIRIGRWDADSYATKPTPFFSVDGQRQHGVRELKKYPPVAWMPLPKMQQQGGAA